MSRSPEDLVKAASKYVKKKILLGVTALLIGMAMIVLFSFVPFTWEPDNLTSNEFITDTLIIIAITILGMVCLIFISQATNANNPASRIAKASAAFKGTKERITDKHRFKQWIKTVQQPRDILVIKERTLFQAGIEDITILNLSVPEIQSLTNQAQLINDIPYPALTEEQVRVCLKLKDGLKVKLPPPEYYLSAKTISDSRTPSERANSEGRKKRDFALVSIVSKIVIVIVVSMIFTMFARDLATKLDVGKASAKFAVRMMNLFSSMFMGFIVGGQLNDIDAEYVEMRTEIHEEYLADDKFETKSIKQEALEEIKQRSQQDTLDK